MHYCWWKQPGTHIKIEILVDDSGKLSYLLRGPKLTRAGPMQDGYLRSANIGAYTSTPQVTPPVFQIGYYCQHDLKMKRADYKIKDL